MPFEYYKRLPRSQQRVYLKSDGITSIPLPDPQRLYPVVRSLEQALTSEDRRLTQMEAQRLITAIVESLKIRGLTVRLLERRPSSTWGELQGLYQPKESAAADEITVWMRTAQRKQVVAFKTFLRTLLHELCHHIDYEHLGLRETFHTQGFFKRESSLFHQLMRKEQE